NELRSFLHDFFLGQRRITDDLLKQAMMIKCALVGGDMEHVTRSELYAFVEALEDLRKEAIRIRPYIKILNPDIAKRDLEKNQHEPKDFGLRLNEAKAALTQTIQVFQSRMQSTNCVYSLDDLRTFLLEARAFVGWEKHFGEKAIPVDNWIRFLKIFRELTLIPENPHVIQQKEWSSMLNAFRDWYSVYLQYQVAVKDRPIFEGVGLQNTFQLGREVFALLEDSVSRNPGAVVPFNKLDELGDALYGLRWIPKLKPEGLRSSIRALIIRVLGNPTSLPSQRKDEGLRLEAISRGREIFYQWAYTQMNLDSRYKKPTCPTAPLVNVPNLQTQLFFNPDTRKRLDQITNSDWLDFLKVRDYIRPLFPDCSYRTLLVNRSEVGLFNANYGFHNLTIMNILRTVTTIVFRGYADNDGNRLGWDSGITSEEMNRFFLDFREAGIDLNFVDRRNENTGARAYIEGNLFNYSSDGLNPAAAGVKSKLSFTEAMEMFAFLWSGGKMAEDVYERVKSCNDNQKKALAVPVDDVGRPKIDRDCVLERLPAIFDELLENMPGLRQFLRLSPPATKAAYVRGLLDTAFSPRFSVRDWVEMSELSTLMVVLHYAEAVMTKYDVNPRNGALDNAEVEEASKVFMGYIKKFRKDTECEDLPDKYARGAFIYILKYRELPVTKWDFSLNWITWFSAGNLSLNRAELSGVFRVIIAKLFESTAKKKENACSPVAPPKPQPPTPAQVDALNAACHDFISFKAAMPPLGYRVDRQPVPVMPPECLVYWQQR
ncbi:MAG: hypothetical protein AB7H97_21805, partial [Pseudobdellovibrionaceae bacterium]